jgi:outer membrane protein insertion porin family
MITVGGPRLWILMALLTGLSVAPAFTPNSVALAQDGRIRDIQVVGNRRVEPETVRSYLRFSVGDTYDAAKVDASIRALFATGLFADVTIQRQGSSAFVSVVENPVVNQVAFEGNREVDDATLRGVPRYRAMFSACWISIAARAGSRRMSNPRSSSSIRTG